MKLKEIRPMIRTLELKETVDFYVNRLGFTCAAYREDWGWAALRRDDIELMVARPLEGDLFEQPAFTGSFYILVEEGIDRLWAELKDQAVICYPVEDFVYGMREFALYDNNGYLLQFGQDTEKA